MVSSKKLGRMVTADVDKALANIGSAKPEMKDDGAELKAAVAPKNDLSFAEAFKANRMANNKTFTWRGKSYSTKMAGEGAKRSAPTSAPTRRAKAEDKPSNTGASETPKTNNPYTAKRDSAPLRAKPTAAAERREKLGKFFTNISSLYTPGGKSKPWLLTGEAAREANRKQGTIGGKAKGGKIDGAAIRGKTRAMKKGK